MAARRPGRLAGEIRLIGYACGNFGKMLVWTAADLSLLFVLTDLLGIAPADAGILLALAMAVDIVGDVVVGLWASRVHLGAAGYRRLMLAGTPICAAGFVLVYALPEIGDRAIALIAAALLIFRGSYSLLDLPHNTLLAHVSDDSRARGRASGYRNMFSALASLGVAGALKPLSAVGGDVAPKLTMMAVAAALLFCLSMAIAWLATRPAASTPTPRCAMTWREIVATPLIAPVTTLLVIAFVTGLTLPMFIRLLVYRGAYLADASNYAGDTLGTVVVGQLLGALLWTWLIRRWEKPALLAAAQGVAMLGFAVAWRVSGAIGPLLIGIGSSGAFLFLWAILADLVDVDQLVRGRRRDAALFLLLLIAQKLGAVTSTLAIGLVIDVAGYRPGIAQPHAVLVALDVMSFAVPALGSLSCILLARRIKLTHRSHAQTVAALQAS